MKFTIDRETWYRGQGSDGSCLMRRSDGKMCCLGHVALQCGLKKGDIEGIGSPGYVRDKKDALPAFLISSRGDNSMEAYSLMSTNDDATCTDEVREEFLIKKFKEHGHELEFIN